MAEKTKPTPAEIEAANAKTIADLSAGLEKLTGAQTAQLVIDLDDAWDEHKKTDKPIVFKFQGKEYEVPSTMPADFGRFYRRHCLKPSTDPLTGEPVVLFIIPDGDLLYEFMEVLAGKEFVDAWGETRLPFEVIASHIIRPVMNAWKLYVEEPVDGVEGAEKKRATPES